MITNNHRRTNG